MSETQAVRGRANKINTKLQEKGLSQSKLARQFEISSNAVWLWVHGRMSSSRIDDWFKQTFGDNFFEEIKN